MKREIKNKNEYSINSVMSDTLNISNLSIDASKLNNRDIMHNSLIDNLKESIKSNVKSYKKNRGTEELNLLQESSKDDFIKIKPKSEKEKLMDYYNYLKNNSRLNTSNTLEEDKIKFNPINPINVQDDNLSPTTNQLQEDFVIFDCFKSLINKNKFKENNIKSTTISSSYTSDIKNTPYKNENNIIQPTQDNFESSFLKDIPILNNSLSKMKNCSNCPCNFYQKKYKKFKKLSQDLKRKYLNEKKNSENLNLKLLNEKLKSENIINTTKLNSTNISKNIDEEESKLTKLLYEKLQENNILFEKLESEIINKDTTINKQNETISHQKQTIDKLLEQFNIFLNQGNYMLNDLMIVKQNLIDKNFEEVTKDFNGINKTINEYTTRIKDFAEKTKSLTNKDYITIEEVDGENLKENIKENFIENIKENKNEEIYDILNDEKNESYLSFSLTKSNIKSSQLDEDRSLRIFELSNNNEDF